MRVARTLPLALLLLAAATPALRAQAGPPDPAAQIEAMRRLDYMVGDWQGEGWIDLGRGRQTFRGGERVQRKLGGVALLVEGDFRGRLPGSEAEVPVHNTLAVISFDPRTSTYRFASWLATGTAGERELTLTDDGWRWEIRHPQGVIRYVFRRGPGGEWHEIGERSADGQTWRQFFEMTLRRAP